MIILAILALLAVASVIAYAVRPVDACSPISSRDRMGYDQTKVIMVYEEEEP